MYILFDIGGTKTRVAASKDLRSFGEPIKFDTPHDFAAGMARVSEAAHTLAGGEPITAVAGGIRGPLNPSKDTILSETVLANWVGEPIRERLEELLGAPVSLENDAALAGLGEAHHGAGKGYAIVAYHTVSTGMGGARISCGKIDSTRAGFEPGKQVIDSDGTLCPPCEAETLEELISGTALERRRGMKPYDIPQDDPVWNELAAWLAVGLKNTIAYWSPEVIVLGGSMIVGDPRILREDIARHLKHMVEGFAPAPPVLDAKLGDHGGLYGAMVLLSQKM